MKVEKIKCRFWHRLQERMISGPLGLEENALWVLENAQIGDIDVMFYTNLDDMNATNIYVDDIISYNDDNWRIKLGEAIDNIAKINFIGFYIENISDKKTQALNKIIAHKSKVIGNTYKGITV